jgi:hypothetical protein
MAPHRSHAQYVDASIVLLALRRVVAPQSGHASGRSSTFAAGTGLRVDIRPS